MAGYLFISDNLENKRVEEFAQFAGVTAETSVAAELYRNDKDSFLIVRDSILNKYGVSINDLLMFKKRYRGEEYYWSEFWDKIMLISDSLIKYHQARLRQQKDSVADSSQID